MDKTFRYRIECKQYMCMCMYSQKIHFSRLDTCTWQHFKSKCWFCLLGNRQVYYVTVSCCSRWVLIAIRSCPWLTHLPPSYTSHARKCTDMVWAFCHSVKHILLGWIGHNIATLFYAQDVTTYSGTHTLSMSTIVGCYIVFQLHLMVPLNCPIADVLV